MLLFLTFFSWKINYLEAAKLELFYISKKHKTRHSLVTKKQSLYTSIKQ